MKQKNIEEEVRADESVPFERDDLLFMNAVTDIVYVHLLA